MRQVILSLKFLIWVTISCFFAYRLIDQNNHVTAIRKEIPKKLSYLNKLKESNSELQYVIEQQENPIRLMELSREKQFKHLKFPKRGEVVFLNKKKTS
ncbi:hypothetical protein [Criblamydia sequanensis]|uniref:Cell division protein ftsL n=1 Tax=Candidatus Criblamydia sequanensis CRIB-18 TaxID=1437425 RepID=A0A090D2V4_9BACT|nr:hypothetical protein [Criblamydia sequanensis]CDR34673.1 Putative cell division protein ftsL [Criblamydia sequanensis CRIB-18]